MTVQCEKGFQPSAISFQQSAFSRQVSAIMNMVNGQQRWLDRPGDASELTANS